MVQRGRPKAKNPKNNSIKVRLDEETSRRLREYSEKHKIRRTDVVRKGLKELLDADTT